MGMNRKMDKGKKDKQPEVIREQPLTYDDYAALDDDKRYELVDGELELMSPGPTTSHQMISSEMQKVIVQTCDEDFLILYAPLDLILSQTEVRQPDLVMIRRDRLHILSQRGIEGIPDVVVEILSPSTVKRDKLGKLYTYAYYGIPEYWIVEPANGVLELYILNEKKYELTDIFTEDEPVRSRQMSCVSFTMQEIMERIPDLPKSLAESDQGDN